jgi:hypothetical protein
MEQRLDGLRPATQGGQMAGGVTSFATTITEQVRKRPLMALGVSLLAGSVIQGFVSGQQGSGGTGTSSVSGTLSQAGSTAADTASSAAGTVTGATQQAAASATSTAQQTASTVTQTAQQAAQTTADTVGSAAQTVGEAAQQAAQTTASAAGSAADATASAARGVASTVAGTTGDVVDTVEDVAGVVSDRVTSVATQVSSQVGQGASSFGTTVSEQVRQNPLVALGAAIGAGALLQPAVAPQVANLTQAVRQQASTMGSSLSSAIAPPNPQEVDRIREALVPATVERVRQFTSRDLREFLEQNLEGIVGQASLRAGVVASVTERVEELVDSRLPGLLEQNLSGARGVIVTGITSAILRARNEAQQGQGQTLQIARTDLIQSIISGATANLQRFFPEFRDRYQPAEGQSAQQ